MRNAVRLVETNDGTWHAELHYRDEDGQVAVRPLAVPQLFPLDFRDDIGWAFERWARKAHPGARVVVERSPAHRAIPADDRAGWMRGLDDYLAWIRSYEGWVVRLDVRGKYERELARLSGPVFRAVLCD